MGVVLIFLCIIVGFVSVIFLFFKKRYSYWEDRGVPFAKPTFPFGSAPTRREPIKNLSEVLYKQKPDNFPFLGVFFLATPSVIPTDLDFIQHILVKDFSAFHGRGLYVNEQDDPLSTHLFTLDGEKWRMLRSKLTPTFTSGKMKFMFSTVVEVADRFNTILSGLAGQGAELEMKDLLARFTTDVIGTCAFGIECNSLKNPKSEFRRYGLKVFEEPAHGMLVLFLTIQFPELAKKLHVKSITQDVEEFFLSTVRETIEHREKNNVKRNDFMDLLIQLKNNDLFDGASASTSGRLNFEEIAAQVFLFFLAGFETSATAMTFSLYELALNPDIQAKARNEVENVLSRHEGKLTYEAIQDMVYLDQIISESIRKYPPVVHLIRNAARDYPVPNTNVTIEKGTGVLISVYGIHHDPNIYKDPEVFDPDRFTPIEIKSRHPMAFLGFGDGPRNCIGLRFGRMQSKIGLATLLKNFRFQVSKNTQIPMIFSETSTALSPKGGVHLKVEKI